MRLLIIGAGGLIGHAACRAMRDDGHEVVGMARQVGRARRNSPDIYWVEADPVTLQSPQDWQPHLKNIDAIIYVSRNEQFERDQFWPSFSALLAAADAQQIKRLVKLTGTGPMNRNGSGLARSEPISGMLESSSLEWVILRPGLVIGPGVNNSQGLLRLGASLPGFLPEIDMGGHVQTIALSDLMTAISDAVSGKLPSGGDFDLVAKEMWTVRQLSGRFRSWLGLPRVHRVVNIHDRVLRGILCLGSVLDRLGWRTPLGRRALGEMLQGIQGDGDPYQKQTGRRLLSFDETLSQVPATTQERWYTRFALLFPLILLFLSSMFVTAGIHSIVTDTIPLLYWPGLDASHILTKTACVILQGLCLLLGIGIVSSRFSVLCSNGILALCLVYAVASLVPLPADWAAPTPAFATVLPLMMLALMVKMMMESR